MAPHATGPPTHGPRRDSGHSRTPPRLRWAGDAPEQRGRRDQGHGAGEETVSRDAGGRQGAMQEDGKSRQSAVNDARRASACRAGTKR